MTATGTLGVRALLDDETTPILGVRYTYRLTQADGPGLLFAWAQLGPPEDGHRALEHILHPYTYRVRDNESSGWPPPHDRQVMQPGSPWLGVSNFAGEPMALDRASRRRLYPRANWGVDGLGGCIKPTAVGQRSVIGREVKVQFARLRGLGDRCWHLQGGTWRPIRAFLAHHVPDSPTPRGYGFAAEGGALVLRTGLAGNAPNARIELRSRS